MLRDFNYYAWTKHRPPIVYIHTALNTGNELYNTPRQVLASMWCTSQVLLLVLKERLFLNGTRQYWPWNVQHRPPSASSMRCETLQVIVLMESLAPPPLSVNIYYYICKHRPTCLMLVINRFLGGERKSILMQKSASPPSVPKARLIGTLKSYNQWQNANSNDRVTKVWFSSVCGKHIIF